MPDRKLKGWHIDCEEVQGEGAYAHFKRPSFGDVFNASMTAEDDRNASLKVIASLLDDWNWVDDNGEPLPLPRDDFSVFERMPWQEVKYLIDQLNALRQDDEKN